MSALRWVEDDGGRADAGFKGEAGDCVARSIAIVTGRAYLDVYNRLSNIQSGLRNTKRRAKSTSARTGVSTKSAAFKRYMVELGFEWHPTMAIGVGCVVHMRPGEVPMIGRHVLNVSKHSVALIDGVIHDTHNPSRGGWRCVYGYWTLNTRSDET